MDPSSSAPSFASRACSFGGHFRESRSRSFSFATGPVWRHPWQIGVLNHAILWSYLPLPFLVAGALAYRRALTLRGFFLDALELTLLKYSITFGLSLVLWSIQRPPEEPFVFHPPHVEAQAAAPAARPTVLDPARLGAVRGVVVDASGAPVANALVYVSAGLADSLGLRRRPTSRSSSPRTAHRRVRRASRRRWWGNGSRRARPTGSSTPWSRRRAARRSSTCRSCRQASSARSTSPSRTASSSSGATSIPPSATASSASSPTRSSRLHRRRQQLSTLDGVPEGKVTLTVSRDGHARDASDRGRRSSSRRRRRASLRLP